MVKRIKKSTALAVIGVFMIVLWIFIIIGILFVWGPRNVFSKESFEDPDLYGNELDYGEKVQFNICAITVPYAILVFFIFVGACAERDTEMD